MLHKKLSRSFAINLQRLMGGETVNAGAFTNKKLLKQLLEDRVVIRIATGRTRAVFRCADPEGLRNYLRLHYGITDIDAYIDLMGRDDLDGEDSLLAATSTKTLRSKGMQGFFIKGFGFELQVDGQGLGPLPDGAEYFISDFSRLGLPEDVLVVGVENPECFQKADRLLSLFPNQPLVFVLRFYSNSLLRWLESIKNLYLHFGDFDPAGIAIYCNEYLARLGRERCRFFVPEDIGEVLAQKGSRELFDRQRHLWPPKILVEEPALAELITVIDQCGKGLEQEWLLRKEF